MIRSLKFALLLLGREPVEVVLAVLTPAGVLVVAVAVEVDPEFLLRVVLDAGVSHVVQAVEGSRDDIGELLLGEVLVDVLGLLEKLGDVGSGADAVGEAGGGVADQGEDGNAGGALALEEGVVAGLAGEDGEFLGDRGNGDLAGVLAVVNPGLGGVGVALELLAAVVLDPLAVLRADGQGDLVHCGLLVDLFLPQRQKLLLPLHLRVVVPKVHPRRVLLVDEVLQLLLRLRPLAVLRHLLDRRQVVQAFHRAPLRLVAEPLRPRSCPALLNHRPQQLLVYILQPALAQLLPDLLLPLPQRREIP